MEIEHNTPHSSTSAGASPHPQTPLRRFWSKIWPGLALFAILFLYLYPQILRSNGETIPLIGSFCLMLGGAISLFMAFRYSTSAQRAQKMPHRATGKVVEVIRNTGFSEAYSRVGNLESSASEQGRGGRWVVFFLFWYELRPDHWYPIISFTDEKGRQAFCSVPYGALRSTWHENDTVEIAWDNYRAHDALPLHAPWLTRKAIVYLVLGAVMVAAAVLWLLHWTATTSLLMY